METIYKGSSFLLIVTFEEQISLTNATLFNQATHESVMFSIEQTEANQYNLSLSADVTANIGVGLYNLELWADTLIIERKENFVKVEETSQSV